MRTLPATPPAPPARPAGSTDLATAPLQILVLHSELGVLRGGGENFTRNLFVACAQRGHRISAAFVADRRGRYPLPLPPSIQPIPLPGWWSRNFGENLLSAVDDARPGRGVVSRVRHRVQEGLSWRAIAWHNRRFLRRVERELAGRFDRFDAIYVHGDVDLAARMAERRPTVLFLAGPVPPTCADALRRVQLVCSNGDAFARIRTFLDSAMDLPIGLDETLFRPGSSSIRQQLTWSDDDVVVGYVGRLTHIKGVDLLASAFHRLSRSIPHLRLLVIGRGAAEHGIRQFLADHIARGVVRMEPDVDHARLPEWYRAMNLFVMPSRYENYSNAVVEAMACGVPLLASDVGGNLVLADAGRGWLFERESASSLAAQLDGVSADGSQLRARGQAAAAYVRGRYSWARSAELLERQILTRLAVNP